MRKAISSILLLTSIICMSNAAMADVSYDVKIEVTIGNNTIYINGVSTEIDAAPVLRNDTTMVPIRVIAEALGAEVGWNEFKGSVSIVPDQGAYSYEIEIGNPEVIVWTDPFADGFDPTENTDYVLETPAFIENERTYLPLRFVSERLGASVQWDDSTQTITIIK